MAHAEVEEQEPSKEYNETLKEDYPCYAGLINMNGFININAAADCENVNHRVRGQCHCFDGDKMSDLGFLQVKKDVVPTNQDQGFTRFEP